jgi:ribokinase
MEVIGFGAMNMDRLYRVERLLTDGEAAVDDVHLQPGGSAANTIYALARLGVSTGYVGAVGDDEEGRSLLADLTAVGVEVGHVAVKPGVATGTVLGLVDRKGQRALYVSPGANSLLRAEDIDRGYLNQAQVLHLSPFVHQDQFQIQKEVLEGLDPRVRVSLAPGDLYTSRGAKALAPLIKRSHVLFVNRKEMRALTGKDPQMGAQWCQELGCPLVVVTLGEGVEREGKRIICHMNYEGQEHWVESAHPSHLQVKDTTGAGDAFAAGFLFGLLKGKTLEDCGLLGDLMAGFCIAQMGAREGLPSPAQLAPKFHELSGQSL